MSNGFRRAALVLTNLIGSYIITCMCSIGIMHSEYPLSRIGRLVATIES